MQTNTNNIDFIYKRNDTEITPSNPYLPPNYSASICPTRHNIKSTHAGMQVQPPQNKKVVKIETSLHW